MFALALPSIEDNADILSDTSGRIGGSEDVLEFSKLGTFFLLGDVSYRLVGEFKMEELSKLFCFILDEPRLGESSR